MFRRSRFSVRPNVGTGGRAAAASQEAPSASQEAGETPQDAGESNSAAAAVTENKADLTTTEKAPAPGDGGDQTGEGTSASAAVQRRKRFSIKPKVAPGRAALARAAKSPGKALAETPGSGSGADFDKPTTSSQTTAAPQGLQSPRRRRPSEETKQPTIQTKPSTISSESSELSSVPLAEEPLPETRPPGDGSKDLENLSVVKVKEVPPRQPEVPPSLPDKEAIEISEKAKTLVSTKSLLSQTSSAFTLSRLLNDPSDLQRLAKAQKLRELLRKEMCKEKKLKKVKMFPKEYTLDPAKMTMSDLIRYLPTSNPMTTSLEDSTQENETVVPPSPVREESPERAQEPEAQPSTVNSREEGEDEAEEDEDDSLLVPQVKVAEDGSLIIDEESLTVEVQRAKGPNPVHNRDPIFERGSTTTYSSFRKGTYSKPWSSEETDMFFLAINMVGTDFSMICQLFPHRARSEIKNKFKKEERENAWRIDKAFRERRKLDIEYFSKLLEKILEYQKNKKKLKSLTQKNSPKKNKKKEKAGKKSAKKGVDEQEGGEVNENQVPDLEKEGEKENEELCNEGETPDSKPKRKRKTKNKPDALTEEPDGKKKKTDEKSNEQGEAGIPEDAEAALPEDHTNSDMSENIQQENTDKDASIKPAKLSRGRAPKPLLPLGRKWGKKHPPSTGEARDAPSDKGDESVSDGAPKEQAQDASPLSQANTKKSSGDDISSEEEDATIKPLRPTRYGRVPKPTRPLNYPSKEDAHSSASETVPASPTGFTAPPAKLKPKVTAKRAMASKAQSTPKSKKPKLVTLRASQSESSDDEIETPWLNEELVVEEQQLEGSPGKDSSAPAFVPASLHTPQPVISEVDETMVELDILASMPDVLGMSQDALCPNSSCEEAHEADTAVPCEHQLDLLVDVIDFLSSEHTEVAEDESYNEAAQTLLTISNLAHLPQSAQNQTAVQDDGTATTSASVDEPSHLEEEIASKPVAQEGCDTTSVSVAVGQEVTETSVASVEVQDAIAKCDDIPIINKSDPKCDEQRTACDPTPQLHSEPESLNKDSPQAKKGRLSKVKPKPNLSRSSRTAQAKSLPEKSAVRTPEENHSSAPSHSQPSDILSIGEERASKIPDCAPALFKDDISCAAKLTDVPSDSQRRLFDQAGSDVATADEKSSEIHSVCLSESHFDSSRDQVSRDTKPASESLDEKQNSCIGTAETGFSSPETSVSAVMEFRQGSSSDPVPVQESCNKPPPIEDLSLSQVGKNEAGTAFQSRRARLPKGRPKPNLPQTSRTVRSKPPSSAEEDSGSTSSPKSHKDSITEVEPQPTCTPTLEKENEITDPAASVSNASLNLDSTLIPTVEASTNEEKTTCVELGNQVELGATTFENQELPKAPFEASQEQATEDTGSTSECTDENLTSHTETISKDLVTTVSAITEPQDGQGSNVVSGPVQEVREQPAVFVKPVEKLTEEGESTSACQPTRRRSQKVKPKPNLSQTTRTTRSKPPTTTETTVEKHSVPAPNSQFHKETITEVEPQSTCSPTPVKESECPNRLLNLDSSHASTEEAHTNEEKTAHVVPDDQAEVGVSEKPSRELATGDTGLSHVETISNNVETTDSAVTESQVGDGPNVDPVQEASPSGHPAVGVKPVEELTVRLEEGERASACQLRRSRLQKPKPNLPLTKRTPRFKPQSPNDQDVENFHSPTSAPESTDNALAEVKAQPTSDTTPLEKSSPASVSVPSLDLCPTHQCTKELPSTEDLNTDVGCEASSSVGSEQNVPQKRRWFPKVKPKPNVGSSTRTKMQSGDTSKPSEQKETTSNVAAENKVVDSSIAQTDLELKEKNAKHLTAAHCSVDAERSSINVGPVDSEKLLDSTNDKSVVIEASRVPEKQPMLTDSGHESKSTNKSTVETKSTEDKMSKKYPEEVNSSSQGDNKLDTSTTESHTQQINDPTPASDMESSKHGSTESIINSTLTTTENPACLEKDSSVQSSETESELTDSKTSRKAPQARRGRLIKPKPNLGRAGRPPQPQKMQNTTAEAESSSCSQGVDPSVDHKPVPDIQQPVGKVTGDHGNQDSPVSDARSSLGCMPQVTKHQNEHDSRSNDVQASLECVTQVSSNQSESPSSKEGVQSFPVLFQEMLPDQVPSDPNEPFFILSLTEIPVSSSGEDASAQPPSSVSGESFAAGDGSFFYVSTEDGNMMDLISVKDTEPDRATSIVSPMEHPLDPHGSVTVQPPETADNDESTKQRRAGPGRTGKLQDKTKPARKKQTDKMETVTTNSTQESDVETNKTGPDPETSSGARTTQRTGTRVWNKKPKDFPSFLSETNAAPSNNPPLSSNAASTQSKVKTQPAESLSEPVAFVSRAVGPEPDLTNPPTETKAEVDMEETSDHSPSSSDQVPSTSQGPTEQSDRVETSSVEEEPTNVSQYFLSDIFTEVDEG